MKLTRNSLKELIRQSIDELKEGGPGSGPGGDEDNPFDKEPSDDELTNIEKEFEGVNESVNRKRTTVKEIKTWMKTLEENRYKKTYNSDCRRVAWLVNNNLSEDYESMPISMRKKWSKAAYGRERQLAKEFLKSKKNEMKLKESIRGIVNRLITEDQYGATDKKFVPVKVDKYAPNTRENLAKSIQSLSGAAFGFSLSEDSEMDDPGPAKKTHEVYNKWAKGIGVKLQKLYKELDSGWEVYHDTFDKERAKARK